MGATKRRRLCARLTAAVVHFWPPLILSNLSGTLSAACRTRGLHEHVHTAWSIAAVNAPFYLDLTHECCQSNSCAV